MIKINNLFKKHLQKKSACVTIYEIMKKKAMMKSSKQFIRHQESSGHGLGAAAVRGLSEPSFRSCIGEVQAYV